MNRKDHCTHPEQQWCDCDWCRIVREHDRKNTMARVARKARNDAMRSLGLKRVKGALGGTYWE